MIGQHVSERLAGRMSEGEREAVERAIMGALAACERQGIRDAAIRVWRATGKRHADDGSNGQCAVLLVRGGHAATIMWRRATQPHTRAAYRVERVMCMRGTCATDEHRAHL